MEVCHINGIFSREHGGPTISIGSYMSEQVKLGLRVRFRTLEGYPGTSPAVATAPGIDRRVFSVRMPYKLGRCPDMQSLLRAESPADVYHLHGAWLLPMYYGARVAKARRRPYLIQMCGAYQLYELKRKPVRKAVARLLFQDRMIREAACLHVNSVREAEELRSLGFTTPMVVIPTGFDVRQRDAFERDLPERPKWPEVAGKRILLYLARIHPNKGIEMLVNVWRDINRLFPDTVLVVVGAGEPAYMASFKQSISDLTAKGVLVWKGFVSENEKLWFYRESALYCLPSFTENFGSSIQEALGFGRPVLTTNGTPWLDIERRGCGWISQCDEASLRDKLTAALSTSENRLSEMGRIAREYIDGSFSLASVARNQVRTYQWLLGGMAPDELFAP